MGVYGDQWLPIETETETETKPEAKVKPESEQEILIEIDKDSIELSDLKPEGWISLFYALGLSGITRSIAANCMLKTVLFLFLLLFLFQSSQLLLICFQLAFFLTAHYYPSLEFHLLMVFLTLLWVCLGHPGG